MIRARAARKVLACMFGIGLLAVGIPGASAGQGSAVPNVAIRLAGETAFTSRGTAEQQGGLGVTFFVRIENTGDATGSFLVDGDHGGAVFDVRYLAGGTGETGSPSRSSPAPIGSRTFPPAGRGRSGSA